MLTKSGLRFCIRASEVPFSYTRTHQKWPVSGVKKMTTPESKNWDHIPQMVIMGLFDAIMIFMQVLSII